MILRLILAFLFLVLTAACRPSAHLNDHLETEIVPPMATNTAYPEPDDHLTQEVLPMETSKSSTSPPSTPTSIPTAVPLGKPVNISANDPRIRYQGRFDFSDPEQVYFDWSGSTIEAAFNGSSLIIQLQDGNNLYNVTIDGKTKVLETVPGEVSYVAAQELEDKPHSIRLTKRTEAYVGGGSFSGFVLDRGSDLLGKPEGKGRQIEFIGDSITAGYGNEGESPYCWFTAETENVNQTYAAITADHLEADFSVVALSGLGVIRNLHADETSSPETAIDFVDRVLAMNPILVWEPDNSLPDVVIINLGTNDFSSLPFPEVDAFAEAYIELLLRVRERYPSAVIFGISGPLMLGPAPLAIETAVERFRTNHKDENVHYMAIENTLNENEGDFGCDWHPSVQGHKKIAKQLVPVMADVLNW